MEKPINYSKWKLDEIRNVYRYEKDDNWAEIDATCSEDGYFWPTRLYVKGELKEFVDHGWSAHKDLMDYCEWQIEYLNYPVLNWWGITWRFFVLALMLFACLWYPFACLKH